MKRVFVVATPRSGTTWLTNLLGNHPQIVTCHHSVYFAFLSLFTEWESLTPKINITHHQGKRKLTVPYASQFSTTDFDDSLKIISDNYFSSFQKVNSNIQCVIDKTPENITILETLERSNNDAYILHLIRDPRAVFASQKKKSKYLSHQFPIKAYQSAKQWIKDTNAPNKLNIKKNQYKKIQYEELAANPKQIVTEIFDWLKMDIPHNFFSEIDLIASKKQYQDGRLNDEYLDLKLQLEKWKFELRKTQIKSIEFLANKEMKEHGYEKKYTVSQKPFHLRIDIIMEKAYIIFSKIIRRLDQMISIKLIGKNKVWKQKQIRAKNLKELNQS